MRALAQVLRTPLPFLRKPLTPPTLQADSRRVLVLAQPLVLVPRPNREGTNPISAWLVLQLVQRGPGWFNWCLDFKGLS